MPAANRAEFFVGNEQDVALAVVDVMNFQEPGFGAADAWSDMDGATEAVTLEDAQPRFLPPGRRP